MCKIGEVTEFVMCKRGGVADLEVYMDEGYLG